MLVEYDKKQEAKMIDLISAQHDNNKLFNGE